MQSLKEERKGGAHAVIEFVPAPTRVTCACHPVGATGCPCLPPACFLWWKELDGRHEPHRHNRHDCPDQHGSTHRRRHDALLERRRDQHLVHVQLFGYHQCHDLGGSGHRLHQQQDYDLVIGTNGDFAAEHGAPSGLNSSGGVDFGPGDAKTAVFPHADAFPITCTIHPSLHATVTVRHELEGDGVVTDCESKQQEMYVS